LLEKKQKTGRGPKVKPEKTEKGDGKKKKINRNFPKTEDSEVSQGWQGMFTDYYIY
jgi:hypothetical protein